MGTPISCQKKLTIVSIYSNNFVTCYWFNEPWFSNSNDCLLLGQQPLVVALFISRTYHMDFELDEVSRQVAAMARDFAQQHIKPYVMEWDEAQHFPIEIMRAMGKLGPHGCSGSGRIWWVPEWVISNISWSSKRLPKFVDLSVLVSLHTILCVRAIS